MSRKILFDDHSRQQTEFTTCYMCACRCGIKVTLEEGKVRFIQGNRNHPVNRGVICAKGAAGIMKQYSPAKLRKPLLRKQGSERGKGEFEEIEWDRALAILTNRLKKIRSTDPTQLAFFTGRDQMQALSGLWAQQFGTPNWAAHGGFCSVNMAVAGLYTIGYSFWEFGAPDWDQAKYFVLRGVAEDHSSNPIKIGLEKLKRRGAKFVSVNPVRTGYSAIADEWLPIRPGTDGLLALSLAHVLLKHGLVDWEFLIKYTNAPWLVVQTPGMPGDGLFARDEAGNPLIWDARAQVAVNGLLPEIAPALLATVGLPDGRRAKTVFSLMTERYLDDRYAPEQVAAECGVPAETIHRIALEMAHVAFHEAIELPIHWTDMHGRRQSKVIGRPVAFHAMRGISAHTNGFHTCRALHLLQMLLGALDGPGNFRARTPYPRRIPIRTLPENDPAVIFAPNKPLNRTTYGYPTRPEELVIDAQGKPLRIDHAYSWESPLAAHGLMHMVITNAVNRDPYSIDTLLLFMANMAWNSTMNTSEVREMLAHKDKSGEYAIPFVVVVDAFQSETVAFADLVLPDTTYLERYDTISLLDRPISEPIRSASRCCSPTATCAPGRKCWSSLPHGSSFRLSLTRTARASSRTTRTSSSTTRSCPASAFSPAGAAGTEKNRCAASPIRSSGSATSSISASSPIRGRRTCATTATRTRSISSSPRSTRCSERRRCRSCCSSTPSRCRSSALRGRSSTTGRSRPRSPIASGSRSISIRCPSGIRHLRARARSGARKEAPHAASLLSIPSMRSRSAR